MRDRQVLVLVLREHGSLVDIAFLSFFIVVFLYDGLGLAPSNQIKEPLGLHRHFQTALHLHALEYFVLTRHI